MISKYFAEIYADISQKIVVYGYTMNQHEYDIFFNDNIPETAW